MVGLGGSGLNAVAEALRLGRSVVGLDAGTVGSGAAGRNGGFLLAGLPDFYHRAVARLGRERAAAIYRLTLDELDGMDFRRVGSERRADSPEEADDCAAMLDSLRADGFPAEPLPGGVLLPTDGAFDPLARCRALAAQVVGKGARLFEGTRWPSGIQAGVTVVAVDGGLETLFPELAGRVRTARLQMLATEPTTAVTIPRPVYARWGYDYWQQLPDGRLAIGGCRDRFLDGEWSTDPTPTGAVQSCIEGVLRDRVGVPDHVAVTHRWAGCVGFTDDHMPVCEEVRPGVFAVGGYSGTGNVLGALYGRAAVRLALGEPLRELEPLAG